MKKLCLLLMLVPFCAGCGPRSLILPEDERKELPQKAELPPPTQTENNKKVLFYLAHAEGDAEKLAATLEAAAHFRPTIIFPAHYFGDEERAKAQARFRVLQSSGKIEIALVLDNQPNLPLVADLKTIAKNLAAWNIDFAWSADVGGQIARGSGLHQKKWGTMPSGFYPPYLSLSAAAATIIKQFRFDWVLAKPGMTAGAGYVGSTAFVVPTRIDAETPGEAATQVLAARIALVDAADLENPGKESEFMKTLAERSSRVQWLTAKEWASSLEKSDLLPSSTQIYEKDYASWLASERQRLAWLALADAREIIETYKNSGRANLKRLDAALEEIYLAEGGEFLLALGQSKFISVVAERSFLATLANVYRLCGYKVPSGLNVWFSNARWKKVSSSSEEEGSGPFYIDGNDRMKWNDRAGDEGGEKTAIYPVGKYPPGSFDLQSIEVEWSESDVRFTAALGGLPSVNTHLVLPLIDVYVDVNRLSGAGAQDVLPGRKGGMINRDAAWEYAVSFSPVGAALYQAVPGGSPRLIETVPVRLEPASNRMIAVIPRELMRGAPKQWRLTVTLSGTESRKMDQDFVAVPVVETAGDRSFGGATTRQPAVSYIDLLAETANEQKALLVTPGSERFVLPMLEAQ